MKKKFENIIDLVLSSPILEKDIDNNILYRMRKGSVGTLNYNKECVLFVFKNVNNHIDGNGISTLCLLHGEGEFLIDDKKEKLKAGDAFLFDDNQEHGFNSEKICIGLSITWEQQPTVLEINDKVKSFFEKQKYIINFKKQKKVKMKS